MATTISEVDNTCAWGPIVGQNREFPWILSIGSPMKRPTPGDLVTSYWGQRHLEITGKLGLGIIVAVCHHPRPLGDTQYRCTVVWNFDPDLYKNMPGKAGRPAWYVPEKEEDDDDV